MVANRPLISIVIVTWNSSATIGQLLDSIVSYAGDEIETVVVDNASQDRTVALVRDHPCRPRVICNTTNRGLAAANNQGMAAGYGQYWLICNPDVTLLPNTLSALAKCAERHPRAAFVVSRLLHPDGSLQPGVGDLPSLPEALVGRRAATDRSGHSGMWWDGWDHLEERRIGHGNEACYLVRREAVADIGPQDERFALDWEGLDWSARAAELGWEVWFCPEAEAVHIGGVSIKQAPKLRWVYHTHRGMYRYFANHRSRPVRPALLAVISVRFVAKLILSLAASDVYARARRRVTR